MQVWALLLILATIVVSALGSVAAVGMLLRSYGGCDHGCGGGGDDGGAFARLLAVEQSIVPVMYPSVTLDGDPVYTDAFPLQAAYLPYKPHLDAATLTADIKTNLAMFEPLLTGSQWTVTRCYLLDAMSVEARGTQAVGGMTSAVFYVKDARGVRRVVIASLPASIAAAGKTGVISLYTTSESRNPAHYRGTWTWRGPSMVDGPAGELEVEWWKLSSTPRCIPPTMYMPWYAALTGVEDTSSPVYTDAFPANAPFVRYKPYLSYAELTADIKIHFPYFKTVLETSQWVVSRCHRMEISSPEVRKLPATPTSLILRVTEAGFGQRIVLLSLPAAVVANGGTMALTVFSTDYASDPSTYTGTWTTRTATRGDFPGQLAVVWGKKE